MRRAPDHQRSWVIAALLVCADAASAQERADPLSPTQIHYKVLFAAAPQGRMARVAKLAAVLYVAEKLGTWIHGMIREQRSEDKGGK